MPARPPRTRPAPTPRPASRRGRAEGAPLGPGSVLWRLAADGRSMLTGTSAGLLQLLHPGLGAGVVDHSEFFTDPWGRILRSIPQIWGTIFAADDGEGDRRGHAIRDLHRDIAGTQPSGRRYHALDPEVFWWAHATFTWEFFRAAQLYLPRPLRGREAEQLYAETVTWYRRYGVSDRVVPVDLAAFRQRFRDICAHELELNAAAERALAMAGSARAPRPPAIPAVVPDPVVSLALRPVGQAMRLMTLGALPGSVRSRFDVPWSLHDRARFAALRSGIRAAGVVAPTSAWASVIPEGTPIGPGGRVRGGPPAPAMMAG